MEKLKKKLVRKQVISLLLIAVVIAVSAVTIVFSNNRQTIFSRAFDGLGGACPDGCSGLDGCNSWERCDNGVCHDTTNGGRNSPSEDSCGGGGQPDPAAPECFSPDKCVGGRWCGGDGKFKDKLSGRCSGGIKPNPVGDCKWTCGNGFGCAKQSDVEHFNNVFGVANGLTKWLEEACGFEVQPTVAPTVPSPTTIHTPECTIGDKRCTDPIYEECQLVGGGNKWVTIELCVAGQSCAIHLGCFPRFSPTPEQGDPAPTVEELRCEVICSAQYSCGNNMGRYYYGKMKTNVKVSNHLPEKFLYYSDGCPERFNFYVLGYYTDERCEESSRIDKIEYCKETSTLPVTEPTLCADYCCGPSLCSETLRFYTKHKNVSGSKNFRVFINRNECTRINHSTGSCSTSSSSLSYYSDSNCSQEQINLSTYCVGSSTPIPRVEKTSIFKSLVDLTLRCISCRIYNDSLEKYDIKLYQKFCMGTFSIGCVPAIY